jgi:hypothetical protein
MAVHNLVMKSLWLLLALVAVPVSVPAAAAEPQAYRLSQAEIDATIAAASHRPETNALLPAAPLSLPNLPPPGSFPLNSDRRVHGEAGFAVSSDGGYALFSSTAVPIGEESFASFSFSYSRIPGYGYGYGNGYLPFGQQLLPLAMPRR